MDNQISTLEARIAHLHDQYRRAKIYGNFIAANIFKHERDKLKRRLDRIRALSPHAIVDKI
jgi:hypothetical protein